jgi:sugar lactone lactonase YvrE
LLCLGFGLFASAATLHDFGAVNVNASATYAFSASISGVSAAPILSTTIGSPFTLSSAACPVSGSTASCTATVTFAPLYPGLQTGAIYAKTSSGTSLGVYFLKGTGMSAQLAFTPGIINTYAGTSTWGYQDNVARASATFRNPAGLALDSAGNIYVADSVNQVIRKITPTAVTTIAGNGASGASGDHGLATAATLNNPTGVALDDAGNLYIADQGNGLIRRVDAVSGVITTVAGGGTTLLTSSARNVLAQNAFLSGPAAVAVDVSGNLFLSDSFHQVVLRVDAVTGLITVYAGGGPGGGSDGLGDGAAATSALFNNPTGLALDASGNLYIADSGNNRIRMVNASTGVVTSVAGTGAFGYAGDGGAATSAWLATPMGVRLDAAGNLYIVDFGNNVIRQKLAATGVIRTVVGNGTNGYSGDGALASAAKLANPIDVAVSQAGALFVADYGNNVIRQVTLSSSALNFSSVTAGLASLAQAVTPINIGNQALTLSALSVSSSFRQVASTASCSSGLSLAAGAICTVAIEFAPIASGTIAGTLSIASNSLNGTGTQTIALSGTGVGGNAPNVQSSTASLNFGTVATGSTQSQTVTLTNSGAGALSIAGISLGGSSVFTQSTNCTSTLAPGTSCTTTITFAPQLNVTYTATLTFTDSAGTSPQQIAISGTGSGGPIGTVGSSSVYFSPVLSSAGLSQSVSFTNTGTSSLTIQGISMSGTNSTDFNVTTTCGTTLAVGQSCAFLIAFTPGAAGVRTSTLTVVDNGAGSPHNLTLSGTGPATPLQFVPVTPCRVVDTRLATGPFGGPQLAAASARSFPFPSSACGIPANAAAFLLNVAVVPSGALSYLTIWPTGLTQPGVATLTSDGRVKADAAIVGAGVNGGVAVYVTQASHVILDISGYFVAGNSAALDFFPLTPCRIADTRLATGPFGGPYLSGGASRSFPVAASPCAIPATAQAFSLNFSVVPHGALGYLTAWPTGQTQPLVSSLNAPTGVVTANAGVTQSGTGGAISVFASNDTDLIIDVNGYFAPQTGGGLSLYTLYPCRVTDTRSAGGQFTGTLNVNVTASPCGVPSSAQAFVLNATVVPSGALGYLSLWANGHPQPTVSTLNAVDGVITSNMAVVPMSNGSISVFAPNPTQVILDIASYFAP